MSMYNKMEREEQDLCDQLNNGEISRSQFNNEMRELQREYRAMEEEACQEAYDKEAENW